MSLGAQCGQLVTHVSHGEIRAGAKLLLLGFSAHVCVCLSVLGVEGQKGSGVTTGPPWPLAQLGFGFLSRAGQRGQPFAEASALQAPRRVRSVHHPTEPAAATAVGLLVFFFFVLFQSGLL